MTEMQVKVLLSPLRVYVDDMMSRGREDRRKGEKEGREGKGRMMEGKKGGRKEGRKLRADSVVIDVGGKGWERWLVGRE
jgi:hypothetical protein